MHVDEYGNKHVPEITSKMANLWEKKIGSDAVHEQKGESSAKKPSPTTVLNSSDTSVGKGVALTEAGSEQASNQLRKINTKDIVQSAFDSARDSVVQALQFSFHIVFETRRLMIVPISPLPFFLSMIQRKWFHHRFREDGSHETKE